MKKTIVTIIMLGVMVLSVKAQTPITGQNTQRSNWISTGMPVLLLAPDATASGLGDAGVASTPDAYSAHWNNAKFVQSDLNGSISTTYTPWMRHLGVNDMNLLYLGGFYKINNRHAVALSATYFSLGEIQRTDDEGNDCGTFHPNEFAIDASYSILVTDGLSLGATVRYIRSDLTNGMTLFDGSGYSSTKVANSIAADLGIYYQKEIDQQQEFAVGGFISNLGAKLRYSDDDTDNEFLPANLRLGARYTYNVDSYNKVNVLFDVNKLLVPTPITPGDSASKYYANRAEYHRTGVISGAIKSFYDAPLGFKEEMQELQLSAGVEYWYNGMFAARLGYFYENKYKGGRQYLTVGAGIRYNIFAFDFSYLIPTTTISNNPLTNTLRISLSVNFGKKVSFNKDND